VNKRLLIIIPVILVLLVVSISLTMIKARRPLQIKADTAMSLPDLLSQAKALEAKGDLLGAKTAYLRLVNEFSNSGEIMNWQKKVEDINIKLLFSSTITAGSMLYEIKPGDTLIKIAKEFKTTADLIMKNNNLSNDKILPGRKIKVWTDPFTIFVDKSQNVLILKTNEEIIKAYIVSTGKDNSTPVGNFKIANKLKNPTWFKAGRVVPASSAENILGTRWLGFNLPGYGIHGTTDPKTLGRQVTQGCVRMSNQDVEELYSIVPQGTEVTIVD
jgi:lipoprotein-anchoring transpeptidase ErfK/SrfK